MEIKRVSLDDYEAIMTHHPHIFNTVAFARVNASKVSSLHCLLFMDGDKARMGIIMGERDSKLLSPFSAPFGGFSYPDNQRTEFVFEACSLLASYVSRLDMRAEITLPPGFYDDSMMAKQLAALSSVGSISASCINAFFNTQRFCLYEKQLMHSAQKNLKRAMRANFEFSVAGHDSISMGQHSSADMDTYMAMAKRAYGVIAANRTEHGYSLSMSWEDIIATLNVIDADFFLLAKDGEDVASAIVFHVADNVVQVIYWGDRSQWAHLRSMNILAHHVFEYYSCKGIDFVDVGPCASSDGSTNYGLATFKETVGCLLTPRFSFQL